MENKDIFLCNSAVMADYLIHNGGHLIRLNPNRKYSGKLVFVFEKTEELEVCISKWPTEKEHYRW